MSLLQNVPEGTQGDAVDQEAEQASTRSRRGRSGPPAAPGQAEQSTGGSLTRVTANFTPRAMAALEKVAGETGDSKTDVLNRAVMVYQTFLELTERGNGSLQVLYPDGSKERLRFLG
ncbi:MAG: hypothetical protein ABW000_12775 [Actinoplanes sp.]